MVTNVTIGILFLFPNFPPRSLFRQVEHRLEGGGGLCFLVFLHRIGRHGNGDTERYGDKEAETEDEPEE